MQSKAAIDALGALAQEHRLALFRMLVQAGPDGMAAGALAEALGVPNSSLSFHLAHLTRAGLIEQRRAGRSLIYSADYRAMDRLVGYLTENCCGGGESPRSPRRYATRSKAEPMTEAIRNVLFLCTGNSARSILAEALLNRDGAGRFHAFSAGSQPKGEPHPMALSVLAEHGFALDGLRSKSWAEFAAADAAPMDLIITVCDNAAGETCPMWPGRPTSAHWGIEDPAAIEGEGQRQAFLNAMHYLHNRISLLINLPGDQLDELQWGERVREIGRVDDGGRSGG